MKKIPILFEIIYENHKPTIVNKIREENLWVLDTDVIASRKWDGAACAFLEGKLYKRWDNKKNKKIPKGAIECQAPNKVTGHHPFWVLCSRDNPSDNYFWEGFDRLIVSLAEETPLEGTYELCGPRVGINIEQFKQHIMIKHGQHIIDCKPDFNILKEFLITFTGEGLVYTHSSGKMCKIRKSDFKIKRSKL